MGQRSNTDWRLIPSENLWKTKSVSAGHAIVGSNTNITWIPVTNFSHLPSVIVQNTTIGSLEEYGSSNTPMEDPNYTVGAVTMGNLDTNNLEDLLKYRLRSCINENLSKEERQEIEQLLIEYLGVFALDENDLGKCKVAEHSIDTGTAKPIHQQPYSSAWRERALMQKQVEQMLKQDIIEPSNSPWASPAIKSWTSKSRWMSIVGHPLLDAL